VRQVVRYVCCSRMWPELILRLVFLL
jgi:hypothetical protein